MTLAEAGPTAILLVLLAVLARAFVTGSVVPGWLYRLEVAQRQKAETQAERNADALAALAKVAVDGRHDASTPRDA